MVRLRVSPVGFLLDSCTSWGIRGFISEAVGAELLVEAPRVVSLAIKIDLVGSGEHLALTQKVDSLIHLVAIFRDKIWLIWCVRTRSLLVTNGPQRKEPRVVSDEIGCGPEVILGASNSMGSGVHVVVPLRPVVNTLLQILKLLERLLGIDK